MSHTVARGQPTPAQLYLDKILDEVVRERGGEPTRGAREAVSVAQVMHHCMKKVPEHVFMINGATGNKITNKQMLEQVIPLARAMVARDLVGKRVMLVARDHERTVVVYLAMLFTGVVPFLTDPTATKYELQHFLQLVEPSIVFCDEATHDAVVVATRDTEIGEKGDKPLILAIHTDQLLDFAEGHEKNIDQHRIPDADLDASALLLPTSGSTGLPKAAGYHHRGMVAQLANTWVYHTQFPTPTKRVMLLTTPQWGTFTMMVTTCSTFQVEILMSPKVATVDHVLELMEEYRPTWAFFGPSFADNLAKAGEPHHFSSLEKVVTLGSQITPAIRAALKEKLQPSCLVCDAYGMTEAQGQAMITDPGAPEGSNGPCSNILHYKIVKSNGEEANTDEEGELYFKGDCLIKEYLKNDTELAASMADGWLRSGDEFTQDADRRLYYRRRIKFCFKNNYQLVSPEEVERVIKYVPCVVESMVCESEGGPAAAVVLRGTDHSHSDVRQEIHKVVNGTLSAHKQLSGGIAFVTSLPRTHTGKVHRVKSREMLQQLIRDGLCC